MSLTLESMIPGQCLMGIDGDIPVEVISAHKVGSDALEVTWKRQGELGHRMVFRQDEAKIHLVETNPSFRFDAEGKSFIMAAESLRIRLAHLFDPYVAVHASRVEPLPHQLTAVYGEMLERLPLRYLLADDPGSGKTIMAGLLIKELMLRGSLERCLIIAPSAVVDQWQDEMYEKFGIKFQELHQDHCSNLETHNPFAEIPLLIARLDMLARNDELMTAIKSAPEWDLVICDEAHRMSASQYGKKLKYTKRHRLGQLVSAHTRDFLLLTATPHNGKNSDFRLFMSLLDADRFLASHSKQDETVDLSDLMRRLTKEELRYFDGRPLFPERKASTISYKLSDKELELYEAVTHYVREQMNRVDSIGDGESKRKVNVGFALQVLQRRLASSPEAIRSSLERRLNRLRRRLESTASCKNEMLDTSTSNSLSYDEDDIDELSSSEIESMEFDVLDSATAAQTLAELESEIHELEKLVQMARSLHDSGVDAKWVELRQILDRDLTPGETSNVPSKLVIFTESRDTLQYLARRIQQYTGHDRCVVTVHGGFGRDVRRAMLAAFNNDPHVRFLVATDAAGEGVNLHKSAHLMVNYDLPWNPNRLEQRFGRIHRIGQTQVCHLWNLVTIQTREGAVYQRLLEKLETARAMLGGKVYDVVGELFHETPLRNLMIEAVKYGSQPDTQKRLMQKIDGAVDVEQIRQLVMRNKLTQEGLDPSVVGDVRRDMERASAQRLQPHHIQSYFVEGLRLLGGSILEREHQLFEISRVPSELRRVSQGSRHVDPVLERYSRVCFEKREAPHTPTPELIAPGHPLLDALVHHITTQHGDKLVQGATLIDTLDRFDIPRVLVFLKHVVRDGRQLRSGKPQVISERLQFVWIDPESGVFDAGLAPYLDLQPASRNEMELNEVVPDLLHQRDAMERQAREYAASRLIPEHLELVRRRKYTELARTEQAVKARLGREVEYYRARVERLAKGGIGPNDADNEYDRAVQQHHTLEVRLTQRLEDLRKQRDISALPPEICGAALVIPSKLLENNSLHSQYSSPATVESSPMAQQTVERLAMEEVMKMEAKHGREAIDVSMENRGYDIESRERATGATRFIEVKGRRADATTVSMTKNEMITAFNAGRSYILAVVGIDDGAVVSATYLPDPARVLESIPGFWEVSRTIRIRAIELLSHEEVNESS